MAEIMREEKIDGVIIAVDTWLGSHEHWVQGKWFGGLKMHRGRPTVFRTFMSNVVSKGLQNYVLPLSLDSVNASLVLRQMKIAPDILHLDAGHDYESVARDLAVWWPLLPPGAVLIGDDYHHDGPLWPGVKRAFNELTERENLPFKYKTPKITVVKPTPST